MITYDGKSYVDVVFRWKGSILQIDSRMWISLTCTWLISMALYIGVPADSFANSGTSYLAILGKVLTFLMVFRSKLTFDRFWKGARGRGAARGGRAEEGGEARGERRREAAAWWMGRGVASPRLHHLNLPPDSTSEFDRPTRPPRPRRLHNSTA